jgi:adenosine deaminase
MDASAAGRLDRLPKIELHLHLEGSVPLPALWTLVKKYGGDPTVPDERSLEERFRYRSFEHFIDTWVWKNGFLREYEDFAFIAEAVARDLARQNVRYVEAFYSPGDFARHGLEPQPLTEALRRGLDRVPEVRVRLVADLIRDFGPRRGAEMLERVKEVRGSGVIGVGIGGSEHEFPPEPFGPVFERARELGFRTSAHAGEVAGPESVWGALRSLHVDRIGHGTRAADDEDLIEHLAEHRIPVEACPLSNVRTGAVARIEDHPVRTFFDRGILVTVNTDDPTMFGNSLAEEYAELARAHGFTLSEIRRLVLNGIEASWMNEAEKDAMREAFEAEPGWTS